MNWNKGYSAEFLLAVVDPVTWRSMETYEIISGSVSKSDSLLMESADLSMGRQIPIGETWVRIHLNAKQSGQGVTDPVFTGLTSVPERGWNGNRLTNNIECYSVLKPAQDVLLSRGYYVPGGVNGAEAARRLLSVGAAPVSCDDNARKLTDSIVAEDGETNLSMALKITDAIGWRLRISGDGYIRICPKANRESSTYDALGHDAIETEIKDSYDWFSCPNVFRAVADSLIAVARDENPDSPFSIVSRGREIWMEETNCHLNDNETIAQYARRRLAEEQSPWRHITYTRRYDPNLVPGDIVRISHPAQDIDGLFSVTSQRIELGYMARTTEEANYYGR